MLEKKLHLKKKHKIINENGTNENKIDRTSHISKKIKLFFILLILIILFMIIDIQLFHKTGLSNMDIFIILQDIWMYFAVSSLIMIIFVLHINLKKLKIVEYNIKERVKELNCLYGISKLLEIDNVSIEGIIRETVKLMPPAWQFPELTSARILFNDHEYKTDNFKKTIWKLTTDIEVNGKLMKIEVYYSQDKPFLKEEENLINDIGVRLQTIIEEKETSHKLKESEEKYRNLFEKSPDPIILVDLDGIIIDCNTTTTKLFGFERHELISKKYINLLLYSLEVLSTLKKRQEHLINGEILESFEFQVYKKDGSLIWVNSQESLIKVGERTIVQVILQDITEKKQAEALIKEENARLIEINQIRKDLITRISHELKTPLNSIFSASQLLLTHFKGQLDNKLLELIEVIYLGGHRMKNLIDDLFDVFRIESGRFTLKFQEVDLVQIINECTKELKPFLNKRNLFLKTNLPDSLYFEVDKNRIKQCIINLLTNAIKNTPHKGRILINISDKKDFTDISIIDTGVGFTELEKQKLFRKFGKIERYGQGMDIDIEGSGLGLFISKEIIQLHGGKILVESKGRNQGSTFIIRLIKNVRLVQITI